MDEDISVVIPTYYRNSELWDAITSVRDQTRPPSEIIVVDDSGEGHAREVATGFEEVTYIELEENHKAHPARGVGVEAASGRYVHFLDDDDRLRSDALERKIDRIGRDESVGVVYGGIELEGGPRVLPPPGGRRNILEQTLVFKPIACTSSTMLTERYLLEEQLPFTNRYGGADDLALIIELARQTKFDAVDEPLTVRGHSEGSWGASRAAIDGRRRILRDYADLYDQFPPNVQNEAVAETYRKIGHHALDERYWSVKAIRAFALALYFRSGYPIESVVELVSSLFGTPGRTAVTRLNIWMLGRTP